ncbi:MAG: tRNA glutamyl-Q(34) synthetase GluQRS, partial [Acetobacteraceae bacterium]
FLLRIEDIDGARCLPVFRDAIFQDLAWLGLDWDGEVRIQSEHLDEYRGLLGDLEERGLVYPCFCTRGEIAREIAAAGAAPHAPDAPDAPDASVRYPGTCRSLTEEATGARKAAGAPYALRLDMAKAAALAGPLAFTERGVRRPCGPAAFGDVVLGRKDAPASYHLAVSHDDALQGVTLVTRGVDLLAATAVHRLLQALFGWPEPAYAHHPLLTDATGRRLAKRDRAKSLRSLRAAGHSPAAVRAMAGVPD